jgi:hypothetical protein
LKTIVDDESKYFRDFTYVQEMRMRDSDQPGSDVAEGLDRASQQNERILARRLHRRRRTWWPMAIVAFGAAGIWVSANLNRDPGAGAFFVQREQNDAAGAGAQASREVNRLATLQVAPSNQVATAIATSIPSS